MDVATLVLAGIAFLVLYTLGAGAWAWGVVGALLALIVFHLSPLFALAAGVVVWAAARSL